jgi:predicted DNA-binding antitoxin AbrB/MazE fold protein
MAITVEATFENGLFRPSHPVSLPEGTAVQLHVSPLAAQLTAEDPLKNVIGLCDGPADGAENHDKYIYGTIRK